jgi:hypothetical protein
MPVFPDPDQKQHALNHELQQLAARLRHARIDIDAAVAAQIKLHHELGLVARRLQRTTPWLERAEALRIATSLTEAQAILIRYGLDDLGGGPNA